MFYLLNFENHEFTSCNNASVAEAKIRDLLASGCPKDSLEIVDASDVDGRMEVDAFRTLCEEWNLVDNSIVDALVKKEPARSVQAEEPTIALWARLGVSLNVTPGELAVLKGSDAQKAEDLLVGLVRTDRCAMDGDTYFPVEANEVHLGDMREELAFDLDAALHEIGKTQDIGKHTVLLHNDKVLVQLSLGDLNNIADAMEYAVDDRRYQADQTIDVTAKAKIIAAADSWDGSRDIIATAVEQLYARQEFPEKVVSSEGISLSRIAAAKQCLIDNGIDTDEAETVLQALGYILMDKELVPEAEKLPPTLDETIALARAEASAGKENSVAAPSRDRI